MNCDTLHLRLTEHAEGALDAPLGTEVERHLAACPACGEVLRDLQDLARLCRKLEPVLLPVEVRRRIEAALAAPGPRPSGPARVDA